MNVTKLSAILFALAASHLLSNAAEPPAKARKQKPNAAPSKNARQSLESIFGVNARKVEHDVVYGKGDDVDLKLDLYFPNETNEKLPVAVYVHGGGWQNGDKKTGSGAGAIAEMVRRGYLVAAVNYRLAPAYKFPAQIEDVKCAIRFLRAHAQKYNLDPNRIGAWGGSAGGHLVALLGTSDAKAGLEGKGGWADYSSRVQAVADWFGPADLTTGFVNGMPKLVETVFGAKSRNDEILKRASPVTYISKEDPPFLIMHGNRDRLVPLSQSEELDKRLKAGGVSSTLVVVKNAGHGFAPTDGKPDPNPAEIVKITADFFDKTLRK